MNSIRQGSIHLFRFAGVDLFLHWSWFLVAAFEISGRRGYSSLTWNVVEYLALFVIVMLHEYGHALACRQVGGLANQIVLWPLGGVAYVDPPPRPGATLWSIAAGPLVNVALFPILTGLGFLSKSLGWAYMMPNAHALLRAVWAINIGLLVFNMLPIYPLDGGQILRSLLWFVLGRARSLMVATILGCGSHRIFGTGFVDAVGMAGSDLGIPADELLEWFATRASPDAAGEDSAPRGSRLPLVQSRAAFGEFLEMRAVRRGFRYLSNPSCVSAVWSTIWRDFLPGLRTSPPHQRVGHSVRCERGVHW